MILSVCMATHNGASYLTHQIESIVAQLDADAELVVVDDASSDDTVRILLGFRDYRIRIMQNERKHGVVNTFARALAKARGDIIFLCDQDDVWHPTKVAATLEAFSSTPPPTLILSNGRVIDGQGRDTGKALFERQPPLGFFPNLVQNRYQGCVIAFRRELLDLVLPFPKDIPMHDSWIGVVNALVGRPAYLPDKLVGYRRHDRNVTTARHGPVGRMASQRWALVKALLSRARTLAGVRKAHHEQVRLSVYSGSTPKAGRCN